MTTSIFRICTVLALGLAGSLLPAQERSGLEGVWDVSVTVTNCQTGAHIRTVRALQMFRRDGSILETANTALRGISEGSWSPAGWLMYNASYWFFRYTLPSGTFASIAKVKDMITLNLDGDRFTSSGTVEDFDANGNLISTGCFTHTANRLTNSEQQR
jgi:hypothetical protein